MRPNGFWRRFVCVCLVVFFAFTSSARAQSCDPFTCDPICFIRGDANVNGVLDMGDAFHILRFFFLDGPLGTCPDTFEVNGDCNTDLSDAAFLLSFLFLGGAAPSSSCPSSLGCSTYPPEYCAGAHLREAELNVRFEIGGSRVVEGAALQTTTFGADARIRNLSPTLEISGWSLSLVAEPDSHCELTGATTAGTDVGTLFDGGFKKTELAPFAGGSGALSAVILSFRNLVTLPLAEGPHSVLALNLSGEIPAEGCAPCRLRFVDGVQRSGQPVRNEVTIGGSTYRPALLPAEFSLCVGVSLLTLDDVVTTSIPLTQASSSRIYVLTPRPTPGKPLIFDFVSNDPTAENALYVRFGAIPSPLSFDAASDRRDDANPRVVVAAAPDQECYVLFQARRQSIPAQILIGRATTAELAVERMTPDCISGCSGAISAEIFGGGFAAGMSFKLAGSGGAEIVATGVTVLGEGHVQAVFDLTGTAAGRYSLVATRGTAESTLDLQLAVQAAATGPELAVELVSSPFFRAGHSKRVTIHYRNRGDQEMPSPLFVLEGPAGTELRLATEDRLPECLPQDQRNRLQCLGNPLEGTPGRLAPGAQGEIALIVRHANPGDTLELIVKTLVATAEASLDWMSEPTPPCTGDQEWQNGRLALSNTLGESWSRYRDGLGHVASRLSSRGKRTESVRELLRFALDSSLGQASSAITGIVRDPLSTPLADRTVAARSTATGTIVTCARTDSEGAFAIAPVPPGSYRLAVDLLGVTSPDVVVEVGHDAHGMALRAGPAASEKLECPPPNVTPLPVTPPSVPEALLVEAARLPLKVVRSIDPNEKEGPSEDVIRRGQELVYTIYFENDPGASAAADIPHAAMSETFSNR